MALARNFKASTSVNNTINLNWRQPLGFNVDEELIVTRTISHFPVELYNEDFPNTPTDSRPVEIFRGTTIVGIDTGTISVSGNTITDSSATFPTNPGLEGRILRDSNSQVHRILSNTADSITLETQPTNGKYVVLPDFPEVIRIQENYEPDVRTEVGPGFIRNLVVVEGGTFIIKRFTPGELANLIFQDSNGTRFIIKDNDANTVFLHETSSTPIIGAVTSIPNSFSNSQPLPYLDNFLNRNEANSRQGTGLLDNQFYYYTVFSIPKDANVAQAKYGSVDSGVSTQDFAIATDSDEFSKYLYDLWPNLDKTLDVTGDLEDLMKVFGFQLNEIHALIDTYDLQDADNVLVSALLPLSEQSGLPSVGFAIGADTLRRIARDMIPCWKLKGTKEGIAVFIRKITTWDITNGTADYSGAIVDFLPNVSALRFFDPNLGSLNVRLTETNPVVPGGRFAKSLPGIVIPGFFTFREFVIQLPNVALLIGNSTGFSSGSNTTIMEDSSATFGPDDSLVGNFLIPNTEEVNDIFEIVANTNTTITVRGTVNNRGVGGDYAILSPLNANRFIILNRLLPSYIPFGTRPGFRFVNA